MHSLTRSDFHWQGVNDFGLQPGFRFGRDVEPYYSQGVES